MADPTVLKISEINYIKRWPCSVYTSFAYFTAIQRANEIAESEFVQYRTKSTKDKRPPELPRDLAQKIIEHISKMDKIDLQRLYKHGHGDCSSWSIMIAHAVEEQLDHSLAFIYLDTSKHRLGLEPLSGVIIDSSARKALQLIDNEEHSP
jgi:hypothetical protein